MTKQLPTLDQVDVNNLIDWLATEAARHRIMQYQTHNRDTAMLHDGIRTGFREVAIYLGCLSQFSKESERQWRKLYNAQTT